MRQHRTSAVILLRNRIMLGAHRAIRSTAGDPTPILTGGSRNNLSNADLMYSMHRWSVLCEMDIEFRL